MKVIVYVEGISDKAALRECLRPLLEQKAMDGIAITFAESPAGDKKKTLLTKVPENAVNILLNNSDVVIVVLPDLYPPNKGFQHETPDELVRGVMHLFHKALHARNIDDQRIADRFRVFCLKHDLEALILAAEEAVQTRLGVAKIVKTWPANVEDQNHGHPPCRVVEQLFKLHGQCYTKKSDAPLILGMTDYRLLADRCPQCFKPFVEFLTALSVDEGCA